jgi:hypothetical protein
MCLEFGVNETWVQDFYIWEPLKKKHNKINAHVFSHARVIEY